MELEITDDDPRPKGYLYTSGQSDYYFIVWMSSNSNVATVDGDGKVTGRNAGTAIITAISDHGERAACKVTVTRKNEEAARKKPTLDTTSLSLVLQYNDLHPTHQLQLTNSDHSFLYVYQWMSSNPEVATVSDKGLVTAQAAGTTTITAMVSNGQALRCSVTVTSDIGKVTLNKSDLLLRTVGTQERLTATVAVEGGGSVPITWVSSNLGVVTVDADGVVTAIADGEAKVTALSPAGRFDVCSVVVGMAAESTTLSMVREVVFGVGFALLLPRFFGLDGVLYSMPLSDILTFLIAGYLIYKTYHELNYHIALDSGERH